MNRILLQEDLLGKYFNEKTLQVAYDKGTWCMDPGDHGYVKGMKGYHDFENDMCICRSFDNPLISLTQKHGFKCIVEDQIESTRYYTKFHIKLSEVKRLLRSEKLQKLSGKIYIKQKNIIIDIEPQEKKKQDLMNDMLITYESLKIEKNNDKISELLFNVGSILRKNYFTREELINFLNK